MTYMKKEKIQKKNETVILSTLFRYPRILCVTRKMSQTGSHWVNGDVYDKWKIYLVCLGITYALLSANQTNLEHSNQANGVQPRYHYDPLPLPELFWQRHCLCNSFRQNLGWLTHWWNLWCLSWKKCFSVGDWWWRWNRVERR